MTVERSLLLVHAHPDDETINQGVTMAKYVAEGARVTLVTCTAGEMGEVLVPDLEHLASHRDDALGEHRRGELEAAMAILGVTDFRFLGGFGAYRDSGMKWHEDGHAVAADETDLRAFANADLLTAASDLVAVIREVRPQVLVTYDDFGFYGHPDHIQAHRVATYAASLAAVSSFRPDLGEAHDIAKIYWGALSRDALHADFDRMREMGIPIEDEFVQSFDRFVTPGDLLAAAVEGREFASRKAAAMRAHATQITDDFPTLASAALLGEEEVLGTEWFRLAKGTAYPDPSTGFERDLFAGL